MDLDVVTITAHSWIWISTVIRELFRCVLAAADAVPHGRKLRLMKFVSLFFQRNTDTGVVL